MSFLWRGNKEGGGRSSAAAGSERARALALQAFRPDTGATIFPDLCSQTEPAELVWQLVNKAVEGETCRGVTLSGARDLECFGAGAVHGVMALLPPGNALSHLSVTLVTLHDQRECTFKFTSAQTEAQRGFADVFLEVFTWPDKENGNVARKGPKRDGGVCMREFLTTMIRCMYEAVLLR
eukprot:3940135-Rhodomonas_salina.1